MLARVGGDDRRQIQLIRHGPGCIRSLAAAGPHQGHGLATAGLGHQPVDFRLAAFAAEGDHHRLQAHLGQHLLPDRLQIPLGRAAGHEQHPAAQPQPLQLPPQLMGGARALHVAPRAGEHRERTLVETDHRAGVGHGSECSRVSSTLSKAGGWTRGDGDDNGGMGRGWMFIARFVPANFLFTWAPSPTPQPASEIVPARPAHGPASSFRNPGRRGRRCT